VAFELVSCLGLNMTEVSKPLGQIHHGKYACVADGRHKKGDGGVPNALLRPQQREKKV
jgi:hypothetical protein